MVGCQSETGPAPLCVDVGRDLTGFKRKLRYLDPGYPVEWVARQRLPSLFFKFYSRAPIPGLARRAPLQAVPIFAQQLKIGEPERRGVFAADHGLLVAQFTEGLRRFHVNTFNASDFWPKLIYGASENLGGDTHGRLAEIGSRIYCHDRQRRARAGLAGWARNTEAGMKYGSALSVMRPASRRV